MLNTHYCKRKKLSPTLHRLLLNQKIKAAEQVVSEDGVYSTRPSPGNDSGKFALIFNDYKEEHSDV